MKRQRERESRVMERRRAAIRDNADVDPQRTAWSSVFSNNFWGRAPSLKRERERERGFSWLMRCHRGAVVVVWRAGQEMGSQWSAHLSYRPLTTLTFRWNHLVHGTEPFGYAS